jgi:hypothetical protein
MRHRCHAPNCTVPVHPKMHMCKKHWYMLPRALRAEIWRTYRPGQERDKMPSAEYMEAVRKTTAFIAASESGGADE